jgi:hypothetical protein
MFRALLRRWLRQPVYADDHRDRIGNEGGLGLHATRRGYCQPYGNYRLISLDKGETWHSVEDGGARITPADPELLRHLRAWETLIERAQHRGPLDVGRASESELDLLQAAGFTLVPGPRCKE